MNFSHKIRTLRLHYGASLVTAYRTFRKVVRNSSSILRHLTQRYDYALRLPFDLQHSSHRTCTDLPTITQHQREIGTF